MRALDIGELAERTGVAPSALRYSDEIGLISAVSRRGLRRQFAPEAELQVGLILMGKKAGFSLTEISAMFGTGGATNLPRPALRARAGEIDRQIRDLTVLRDVLTHVAECPAPSHLECPRFKKLLRVTARPARRAR